MTERQPRNYARGAQGGGGAPSCLLPPYVDMPEGAIVRETESSRVSPARDPRDELCHYCGQVHEVQRMMFAGIEVATCPEVKRGFSWGYPPRFPDDGWAV